MRRTRRETETMIQRRLNSGGAKGGQRETDAVMLLDRQQERRNTDKKERKCAQARSEITANTRQRLLWRPRLI